MGFRAAVRSASGGERFAHRVVMTLATNALLMLVALVTGSISARILGVAGRGELASIQLWAMLALTIMVFGTPAAVTYFAARDPEQAGDYTTTALAINIGLSAVAMLVCYLALPRLLAAQPASTVDAARQYLWSIPIGLVMGLALAALQGRTRLFAWNALRVLAAVAWLIVLGFAWISGRRTAPDVARIYLIALAAMAAICAAAVVASVPGPFQFRRSLVRPLYAYAVPSSLATLPQQSVFRLDQILIAALLSQQLLGLYAVAVTWSGALAPLSAALSFVVFPHLARLRTAEHQADALGRVLRFALLFNLALTVPLLLVTPLAIVLLFGRSFEPAVRISMILVVAAGIGNVKSVLADAVRGSGAPYIVMWGELAGFATMLLVLVASLRAYGLYAAAAASLLGYVTTLGVLLAFWSRRTGTKPVEFALPTRDEVAEFLGRVRGSLG